MCYRTPCSEGPVLSHLSAVAGLKIPNDVVFDLVFCKSSPVGKQSMCTSRGTTRTRHAGCSLLSRVPMAFAVPHDHTWDFSETQSKCKANVLYVKEVTESLMRPPWETFRTWACFENRSQWWSKKNDQETLSYPFLLPVISLLWKWQHRKKGKDRLTYSSFSLQFFLTPHKVKRRECWQNVSGSEIKRVEFILCTGSTVLFRTKYAYMHMCASYQNQIVNLRDSTYELTTHICTESWYGTIQRGMENSCY